MAAGLRITAIATSEQSQRQALGLRIPMSDFAHLPRLDLTIDGADEVQQGTLDRDQRARRSVATREDRCDGE